MEINDDNMGIFYGGNGKLLGWQLFAVIIVSLWSGLFTYITLKIISLITNLDISPETEEIGLDINNHGEKAYDIDGKEDISSSEN